MSQSPFKCENYNHAVDSPEHFYVCGNRDDKENIRSLITYQCNMIKDLLLEKNRKYGNSALEPSRIFSNADVLEQLRVRIDDKLNRVRNMQQDEDEDVINDLIGYLILYKIALIKEHS